MVTKRRAPSEKAASNGLTASRNRSVGHVQDLSRDATSTGLGGFARQGGHVIEMQHRRLLLAFVEVIAKEGIEGASVGSICRRAGVSRRTFYEIFENREACFLAAIDTAIERIGEYVLPAYEQEHEWSSRIRDALTALLECFDTEPGLARLCVVETLKGAPQVAERRKHLLETLIAAVDEGRRETRQGREVPPLTGQGVVGGALSVIYAHLLDQKQTPLLGLVGPLMGMIVHPYRGAAAARRELDRVIPDTHHPTVRTPNDPFKDLPIRFTFRTALVLATIATDPGASNRHVANTSGISDDGQMSRLLRRLQHAGLIENRGEGQLKGEPNAWSLTERGEAVQEAIAGKAISSPRGLATSV